MKTESVDLKVINQNAANPRTITQGKFAKLVNSLLVFPKMMELRPIVVDNDMTALGGNMRLRALISIAEMDFAEVKERICKTRDYPKMKKEKVEELMNFWKGWKDKPKGLIIKATDLTEQEKEQFIIKDNAAFGQWDYDMLADTWEKEDLVDWGIDVWEDNKTEEEGSEEEEPKEKELDKKVNKETEYSLKLTFAGIYGDAIETYIANYGRGALEKMIIKVCTEEYDKIQAELNENASQEEENGDGDSRNADGI